MPKTRPRIVIIIAIFIGVLVIVRLVLPYVELRLANKNLAAMKGYYGKIKDIDLAIVQGAYVIDSIYLNKRDTVAQKETSFFSAQRIDLSIEWKAIFRGSVVGELRFENPTLLFIKDKVEPEG